MLMLDNMLNDAIILSQGDFYEKKKDNISY